jgi:cytochrome c553
MKRLILLALLFAFPAAAEDYTLTLSQAEIQQIGAALSDKPFKEVAALIAKLQAQVNAQQAKEAPPTTDR